MIPFKQFIKEMVQEDAPVNSGVGSPAVAAYDPLLGGKKKRKMLRRPRLVGDNPNPTQPRVSGMEM